MLNENVKKVLKESMWDLATCADNEPNVVPVAFKDVTEGEVVATFKAMVEKMFNGAATAKGAPVFIRAWRSLFWKITTHKFHSYFKKALRSGKISAEKSVPLLQSKKWKKISAVRWSTALAYSEVNGNHGSSACWWRKMV